MNLNQLKYFISVAEHQSFTKAANQFYISQTAITQQIQALETAVDTPLIDRTTRPISLTPSGKTFLIEAKSILTYDVPVQDALFYSSLSLNYNHSSFRGLLFA